MKNIKMTKKINIIIVVAFIISIIFSNCSLAVGGAFSAADDFLGKRRFGIKYNKWGAITSNFKFYIQIVNGNRYCSNAISRNNYRNTIYGSKCRR